MTGKIFRATLAACILMASSSAYAGEVTEQESVAESTSDAEELNVFAGGSGTEEDPWQIEDPEQLLAMKGG